MNTVVIAIAVYVGLLLAVSLWHNRKGLKGNEDFLIADRRLGAKMAGLSIFASFVGGGTLMGNTSLVFAYGAPMMLFTFALPFGLLLLKRFSKDLHEKSKKEKWLTFYDMFESRFGYNVKIMVAVIQSFSLIMIATVALIGGSKMIEALTDVTYTNSVLLMSGIVAVYLMISGFSSVVKTDFIQGVFLLVIFVGVGIFSVFVPVEINSYADF